MESKPSVNPLDLPPINLHATLGTSVIDLVWGMPRGTPELGTGWKVYRSTISGAELASPPIAVVQYTEYEDDNVTSGITYYYAVTWYNKTGESPPSTEVSATLQIISSNQNTVISFIDVVQGDSVLIKTSDSKHILIDAGPESAVRTVRLGFGRVACHLCHPCSIRVVSLGL